MPTARRSRTIAAPAQELWEIGRDPHHLPRWWPKVTRVEDVREGAFTEVMKTSRGHVVRADFKLTACDEAQRTVRWAQEIAGTPVARVLSASETELRLAPAAAGPGGADAATEVTIELRQRLTGFFPRFGGFMVRRAAAATLEQALDGLELISV